MGLFAEIERALIPEPTDENILSLSGNPPTPKPDLSKIKPDDRTEYTDLWYRAHELADYVDGGDATAPYEKRIKKLPELNRMVEKMRTLEATRTILSPGPGSARVVDLLGRPWKGREG